MNNIKQQKHNAIENIIKHYEDYKGNQISILEKNILILKDIISIQDFDNLYQAFIGYRSYICSVLAGTQRVFVRFQNEENINVIDNQFLALEDLDS